MPAKPERRKTIGFEPNRLEGVELCAVNARRLLDDSSRVSDLTAISLIELSLEEVAKGFMLIFRGRMSEEDYEEQKNEELNNIDNSGLERKEIKRIKKFYSKIGFDLYRDVSADEFKSHKERLSFLSLIITFYSEFAAGELERDDVRKSAHHLFGRVLEIDPATIRSGISDWARFLKIVKHASIQELREIRERGFYVEYQDGHFFYPSAHLFQLAYFRELAASLIPTLEMICHAHRKDPDHGLFNALDG